MAEKAVLMGLTLELSGRCRDECQDTATLRSSPLERIVRHVLRHRLTKAVRTLQRRYARQ